MDVNDKLEDQQQELKVDQFETTIAGGDEAAKALEGQELGYTPEEEQKLVRKMDWRIMSVMAFGIGFQLVDKNALGGAATLTIQKDLHLVGKEYSWAVSIFYFGLLVGTYPANMLLQRYDSSKVIAIAFFCWATTMLCTLAVKDFAGLAVVRFLLGIFESAVAPGFAAITSRFYTPKEQPWRMTIWNIATIVFPIVFLAIYAGIGRIDPHPLSPWRYIFLILGVCSFIAGGFIWFFLPDSPDTCKWLTPRERSIAVQRMAAGQTGIRNHKFVWSQAREALTDLKLYLCLLCMVCQQSGINFGSNFVGIVIKGFGISGVRALVLQIPQFGVALIAVPISGYVLTRVKFCQDKKSLWLAAIACNSVFCTAMIYTHPPTVHGDNKAIALVFIALLNCNAVGYGIVLAMIGGNFAGATKRQTALTMVFIFYCLSNICIPQSFKEDQAPRYQSFVATIMSFQAVYIVAGLSLFLLSKRDNRRKAKQEEAFLQENPASSVDTIMAGLADETDKRNPRFRYAF